MVEKSIILKTFNDILTKCPTIAEMHDMINNMVEWDDSSDKYGLLDKYDKLKDKLIEDNLLNPLEKKDYTRLRDNIVSALDGNINEEYLKKTEKELFQYTRRLIEGVKSNPIPEINKENYHSDTQYTVDKGDVNTEIGELENKQILSQQEKVKVDPTIEEFQDEYGITYGRYVDDRLLAMNNYFDGDTKKINYTISHEGYLKALDSEQRKQMKNIDRLMDESPGLVEDTILYRGGHWDIHLNPGDHSNFKGYMSTTFQKDISEVYKNHQGGRSDMTFIIHAPKGTKGIVGNDDRFYNNLWEHEYVLPRNTGYTVLNVDYENMVAEIVLDEA